MVRAPFAAPVVGAASVAVAAGRVVLARLAWLGWSCLVSEEWCLPGQVILRVEKVCLDLLNREEAGLGVEG